jgi:hypothetical protein
MKAFSLVALLALGCGGKKSGDCESAVDKAVDGMAAARKERLANAPPELAERAKQMEAVTGKLKAAIVKRCVEDKWSAEVIDCYAKASSMPDMKACRNKLPTEQASNLQADEMNVMMSAMGGMAGGLPPPHEVSGAPEPAGSAAPDIVRPWVRGVGSGSSGSAAPSGPEIERAKARLEELKKVGASTGDYPTRGSDGTAKP